MSKIRSDTTVCAREGIGHSALASANYVSNHSALSEVGLSRDKEGFPHRLQTQVFPVLTEPMIDLAIVAGYLTKLKSMTDR
jgi:hypothetical protein